MRHTACSVKRRETRGCHAFRRIRGGALQRKREGEREDDSDTQDKGGAGDGAMVKTLGTIGGEERHGSAGKKNGPRG